MMLMWRMRRMLMLMTILVMLTIILSATQGPGASDNMLNCGIMIEVNFFKIELTLTCMQVARIMILKKAELVSDLIFLFNGAEESGLLAAHGFITKHR